ncbi:cytochrome P450 [Lasiosphaeris hirsuta]|uniref:Cytochrome P450 monooxygenase ABA1 n=1 Tax=Lasiosphaeris hirsuta TaxID=260670 RepID=A0AA40ANI3_9PEZI|nr:cytochrome P450 [Lasiosphaeris hirsuta]
MSYLLTSLVALVAYYTLSSIIAWHRLRHFKGPPLASFSYLWMARTALSGEAWKIHFDNSSKYGEPLIRIGPDVLITDEPDIIRCMGAARSPYRRSSWYNAFRTDPYFHSMLSTQDEDYHQDLKSRTAPAYSGREMPSMESDIDGRVADMKELIRRKYISTPNATKPMDLAAVAQYFTLDAVTKIAFGKEWGYLATESDVYSFISSFNEISPFMALCCDIPWFQTLFFNPFVLKLAGPKETDDWGFGKMMGITKEVATKAFKESENQLTMLGSFIRHGLTQRQIENEVPTVVVAGSDTTAGVIRGTLLYIMTTPRVYQCLQAEIDDAVRAGNVSSPISQAEAKALPYLQAVIYEGIRIHPPNQILIPKLVPPGGDTLLGRYFVPGGTRIAVNLLSMMRHKDTFGEDAYLFRPERWLEVDTEKRQEMERHAELIFGYGRYMCSGKAVAFLELSKIFFELLKEFDFQLIYPKTPWKERQYSVFVLQDMWVRVTERQIQQES